MENEFFEHHMGDRFGWFTSKERALIAIDQYQTTTMTKFIKFYHVKYDTIKSKIRWISFQIEGNYCNSDDSVPYIILESLKLECEHGKDRAKSKKYARRKKIIENEQIMDTTSRKRKFYSVVQESKKKDCEAAISLKIIIMFPSMKLELNTKRQREITSKLLRDNLQNDDNTIKTEYRCYVHFPSIDDHSGHLVADTNHFMALLHKIYLPTERDPKNNNNNLSRKQKVLEIISKRKQFFEVQLNPHFGWFSSLEKAYEAVEFFEIITETKFIDYYRNTYDINKSKIRWNSIQFAQNTSATCDQMPYVILTSVKLECHRGRNKDNRATDQRTCTGKNRTSKKKDCMAAIFMKEIIIFPQFEIISDTTNNRRCASKELRFALQSGDSSLLRDYRCYVNFPDSRDHTGHEVIEDLTMFLT